MRSVLMMMETTKQCGNGGEIVELHVLQGEMGDARRGHLSLGEANLLWLYRESTCHAQPIQPAWKE